MIKIVTTTVEQGKHLMKLGVDPSSCDAVWRNIKEEEYDIDFNTVAVEHNLFSFRNGYIIPAWTLESLMKLLPDEIDAGFKTENGRPIRYFLCIDFPNTFSYRHDEPEYLIDTKTVPYTLSNVDGKTWTEAAYNMLSSVLENNNLKKYYNYKK